MIKVENIEVFNLEGAIRGMRAKGYRKTANGKFETFIKACSRTISLGTYDTEAEAAMAVYDFRLKRFVAKVGKVENDLSLGKVYERNYIAFPSGNIYNLHGEKMLGGVNRDGYQQLIINGKNVQRHRIIAQLFVENHNNSPCVNHKDGNKINNNAENLEWCTHSENTIHAYRTGLEKIVTGEAHHSHKLTKENVLFIRKMYRKRDKYYGAVPLSILFGVDRTTILDVANRKTWRSVS